MLIKSVLLAAIAAVSAVMAQSPSQRTTTVSGTGPDVMLASRPLPPGSASEAAAPNPVPPNPVPPNPATARKATVQPAAGPVVGPRLASGDPWAAIAFAKQQLGRPYQWGGTGNPGFDCSGLVMKAWQAGGVYLPRTTYQMAGVGTRIGRDQLEPGDLVFSNDFGHVQLYLGGGYIIEAARPGTVVRIAGMPSAGRVNAYTRVRS
jgi:cell wall-associated NlpC family hydrolase